MASQLRNYLRSYRKRAGFSQAEIAFLFGAENPAKVSRYEHAHRQPSLRTVLAYEAVFRVPSRDLFAGAFRETKRMIQKRAAILLKKLVAQERQNLRTLRKVEMLKAIAETKFDDK